MNGVQVFIHNLPKGYENTQRLWLELLLLDSKQVCLWFTQSVDQLKSLIALECRGGGSSRCVHLVRDTDVLPHCCNGVLVFAIAVCRILVIRRL